MKNHLTSVSQNYFQVFENFSWLEEAPTSIQDVLFIDRCNSSQDGTTSNPMSSYPFINNNNN